jgi:hypothetical protein
VVQEEEDEDEEENVEEDKEEALINILNYTRNCIDKDLRSKPVCINI